MDIYKSVVVNAYIDKKINLSKAAEILGTTRIELQREWMEKGIPIRSITKEDATAEAKAVRHWTN